MYSQRKHIFYHFHWPIQTIVAIIKVFQNFPVIIIFSPIRIIIARQQRNRYEKRIYMIMIWII